MQFLLSNSSQQIFRLTSFEKNWKLLEAKIMQCTFLLRMYFSKQNSKTDITLPIEDAALFLLGCDYIPFPLCSLMPP